MLERAAKFFFLALWFSKFGFPGYSICTRTRLRLL